MICSKPVKRLPARFYIIRCIITTLTNNIPAKKLSDAAKPLPILRNTQEKLIVKRSLVSIIKSIPSGIMSFFPKNRKTKSPHKIIEEAIKRTDSNKI